MRPMNTSRLRGAFFGAAVCDWAFAIPFLFRPSWAVPFLGRFGLPFAKETFYVQLVCVQLFIIGAFYLVTRLDPEYFLANVAVALAGRALVICFYIYYILMSNQKGYFLCGLVVLNLVFEAWYLW